jgi:5-methyltetrahydrofolate--homocysteine methyltransferase
MKTILHSEKKIVTIETDGPFIIIGEKINPTGRKKLAAAITEGNYDYVRDLACRQVETGADILDINVGVPGIDEVTVLPQVAQIVSSLVDVPLCIDSANRNALIEVLKVLPGKPLVNSVNGEEASLSAILPVIKEYKAAVIGLTMDENGISNDPEVRLSIATKILERATRLGIPAEDVIIDPLVLTIGADQEAALVTLTTIKLVRREFGVNINIGASNVSFGLPDRHSVNQAFLAIAMSAGASCAITDPEKLSPTIKAADLLLGRDEYATSFITNFRQRQKLGLVADVAQIKP